MATPVIKISFINENADEALRRTQQMRQAMVDAAQAANNLHRAYAQAAGGGNSLQQASAAAARNAQATNGAAQSARAMEQATIRQMNAIAAAERQVMAFTAAVQRSNVGQVEQARLIQAAQAQFQTYSAALQRTSGNQLAAATATNAHRAAMQGLRGELAGLRTQEATQQVLRFSNAMNALSTATVLAAGPLSGFGARVIAIGSLVSGVGAATAAAVVGVTAFTAATGIMAVQIAKAGDEAKRLEGRINAITGAGVAVAAEVLRELRAVSIETGIAIGSTVQTFTRFDIAAQQLGVTRDRSIELVEVVQKLGIVGGASTQEISAGLMQLGQGLASGRLQGDELRSVLENMPPFAVALAEALGVSVGELRDLGAAGELVPMDIFRALPQLAERANEQFGRLPVTIDRAAAQASEAWSAFTAELDKSLGISEKVAAVLLGITDLLKSATDQRSPVQVLQDELASKQNSLASLRGAPSAGVQGGFDIDAQRLANIEKAEAAVRNLENAIRSLQAAEMAQGEFDLARVLQKQEQAAAAAVATFKGHTDGLHESIRVAGLAANAQEEYNAAKKAETDLLKDLPAATAEQIAEVRRLAVEQVRTARATEEAAAANKDATEEAKRLSAQRAETIDELQDELRHQQDLRRAHEQGEEAINAVTDAREAELIIQKLKLADTDIEIGLIEELIKRINEQKRAIGEKVEADRESERAADRASKAQQKAAKEADDAHKKVIDNIRDFSEEALGDSFYDALRGETVDVAEFIETTLLRTLANIAASAATNAIVIPIATQVVGAVPGAFGLSGQPGGASGGGGGFSPVGAVGNHAVGRGLDAIGFDPFGQVSAGFGNLSTNFAGGGISAAMFGQAGGSAAAAGVAAVPGGMTNAATSGLFGAGGSMTAAGALGIAGIVAALGLAAYTMGIIGPNPSVGPTGVARLPNVLGRSEMELTTDNGGSSDQAEQVAQSIRDISRSASEALGAFGSRAFGLDIGGFAAPEDGSGQPAGFNLKRIIDNVMESEDFAKGLTADEAITEGVRETLQRAFDGFDIEGVSTALENSAAKTIEELLSDLDLANAIGTFAAGGRDALMELTRPLTAVEQAFRDMSDAAEEGVERARELGLSVNDATAYFAELRDQLEEQTQAGFTAQIRELQGRGFLNQIQGLLDARGQNARSAAAAGLDVNATAGQLFNLGAGQILSQLTAAQRALVGQTFGDQQLQDLLSSTAANDNVNAALADFTSGLTASARAIDAQTSALESQIGAWRNLGDALQQGRIARALNPETSVLSFTDRFAVANQELSRLRGLALGGDQNAIQGFDAAADAALQQAINLFGTNDQRTLDLFNQVQSDSRAIEGLTVSQIDIAQGQLTELQAIRATLEAASGTSQDFGANPVRNRILAGLTNFTGDFGAGAFQQHAANQNFPPELLELISSITSSIGFDTGASFTVGGVPGVDRNLISFKASRGEMVNVSRRDNMADVSAKLDAVVDGLDRIARVVIAGEEMSGAQRQQMLEELAELRERAQRAA